IVRLKNLQSLSLNVNSISMLPEEIGELQSLRSLNLSDNPGLQNIDAVTGLENMEELLLFGCGLDSLPADISKLRKLTCLGLTGNNISSAQLSSIKAALPGCRIVFTR
ncbi:MAG TPA: leucine-rich repeat domain-containing protein, partial [Chitinophagaceae bacterium]|nr:leucine-rich repeat domain-containing protein [Chitinophagaceae bacterium]